MERMQRFLDGIDHRIAVFDEEAESLAANLDAVRRTKGRVGELRDTMIAGIVLAHHARLATRKVTHFADIRDGRRPGLREERRVRHGILLTPAAHRLGGIPRSS